MAFEEGTKLLVLAPVVRRAQGCRTRRFSNRIRREGFTRVRVDGEVKLLEEDEIKLEKTYQAHHRDRCGPYRGASRGRRAVIAEACELAVAHGRRACIR